MGKEKRVLNSRQVAVVDDLFAGDIDEAGVLQKHQLSRSVYRKWLADEVFTAELDLRIESAMRQSKMIIARFAPVAAFKLVRLTDCEKEETARKACIDIISTQAQTSPENDARDDEKPGPPTTVLSAETASKMLQLLAEETSGLAEVPLQKKDS